MQGSIRDLGNGTSCALQPNDAIPGHAPASDTTLLGCRRS